MSDHDPEHQDVPLTRGEAQRILKQGLVVILIFGVIECAALALSWSNQQQINNEALKRTQGVQQGRFENTRNSCLDTNRRNRSAQERIHRLTLASLPPRLGAELRQAARVIVEEIAPSRPNCERYARMRVFGLP